MLSPLTTKITALQAILCIFAAFGLAASAADEEPPDEVFELSAFDMGFHIPSAFTPLGKKRGYLQTDHGKTPYRDFSWKKGDEMIVIRQFVVPEVTWHDKSPSQAFSDAKKNILAAPETKLVSERDYDIAGCSAHTFIFQVEGDGPHFERMDYILTKPDLNIVMYSSPNKAALDDVACQDLFRNIVITLKAPK